MSPQSIIYRMALRTASFALFLFFVLVALASVRPIDFSFPVAGLDPSWVAAVSNAVQRGAVFGIDTVFTMGPFSSLYHRMYIRELAPAIVVVSLLWSIVLSVELQKTFLFMAANEALQVVCIVSFLLIALAANHLSGDGLIFFFIYCACGLYVLQLAGTAFLLSSIVVIAAFCMAKFSMVVFAIPAFIIVDLLSVYRREVPYKTAWLLLCSTAFFVGSGQALRNLPAYVEASLEVLKGYTGAMSIAGNFGELSIWIVTCLVVVGIASKAAWPAVRRGGAGRWTALAHVLLLLGYLGVISKAGFVRHDGHSMTAWIGLFLAIPLITVASQPLNVRRALLVAPLMICFLFIIIPSVRQFGWSAIDPLTAAQRAIASAKAVAQFAVGPTQWLASQDLQLRAAQAMVKQAANLPAIPGSVDVIPSRQGEVLASGLDYRPRPTLQEYTTYSRSLIERNREFFSSGRSPDYILFAPGSIDGRHPASAEGALWPLFLKNYEPVELGYDLLTLRKRSQPLPPIELPGVTEEGRLGERIAVPRTRNPLFVKIDARLSLLGRVAEAALKAPALKLRALYDNGSTEEFRLIPEIAREGAILVPTISTNRAFLRLYSGDTQTLPRPIAFEVVVARFMAWAYRPQVAVSFQEIESSILAKNYVPVAERPLGSGLDEVAQQNPFSPPMLEPAPDGIFAHAPSEVALEVAGRSAIDLGFGIRDGAWQGADYVQGVCFAVDAKGEQRIWSRCLNPKVVATDRGLQSTQVTIPLGIKTITLRTSCVSNCAFAWSYWSKAEFVAR